MSLLWTVFLSCLIAFFLIDLYGKFTLVTGETTLVTFRTSIHPAVGYFFIVTRTAHICGSVIGVMGIVADVCFGWSKHFVEGGLAAAPVCRCFYGVGLCALFRLVQFRVTRLDVGLVLVIGFSALSITSTASLSTSTKTGQADCYPYAHFCEPGPLFRWTDPCVPTPSHRWVAFFVELLESLRLFRVGSRCPKRAFDAVVRVGRYRTA